MNEIQRSRPLSSWAHVAGKYVASIRMNSDYTQCEFRTKHTH